jgi:ATP-binding cassette subfamily B (MDR/TAP) protein 6
MLGTIYRSINTSLVDTERLLKLLNEPTDVNDKPNAPDLIVTNGEIEFGKQFTFFFPIS